MRSTYPDSSIKRHFWPCCVLLLIIHVGQAQDSVLLKHTSFVVADSRLATAKVGGTVVDENDAVVADANVLVKDLGKGIRKETHTNQIGLFTVSELQPGNYTVAVQHPGFATSEIRGLALKLDDQLALKIQLKAGQINETVTIDADSSIVQTSPAVSISLNRQMVENLPLNGRSLQSAITLSPGVTLTRPTFNEQGQFSVNGQRASANYFIVDGVSANIGIAAGADGLGQSGSGALPGLSALGSTHSLLSIDSLQEFKILTSSYAAENGRLPGAQVIIQTRAGTNQFRGSFFEYFRPGKLSANDWFANRDGLQHPPAKQHDFGGVLGGPILKNKTFFFFSHERLRLRLPQVVSVDVPSNQARDRASAAIRPFLNAFPVPNGEDTGEGLARFFASSADKAFLNATSIRVDQRVGSKISVFGRYSYEGSETETRGGGNTSLNTTLQMSFITQTLTIGGSQVITPNVTHDFRVNYSKTTGGKYFQLDNFGGAAPFDPSVVFPAGSSVENSLYTFNLLGNTSFSVGKDATNFQRQINLVDDVAILSGAHQIKFGLDYRRLTPTYGQWKYKESANFNGIEAALTGIASSVVVQTQDKVDIVVTNFSAYAQDVWKLSRRLNLTYGLRWEVNPPPQGRDGQSLLTVNGLSNPQQLILAGPGTPYYRTTYGNFAPRMGIGFQLSNRQGWERMVRAGFGIFYDVGSGSLANGAVSYPYLRRKVFVDTPYPASSFLLEDPPPGVQPPVGRIYAADPNLRLPLTMQWNLTFEQSLGAKRSLSASYVGAVGRRLLRLETLINPNPTFAQVFVTTNKASSSYHALQIQFQRRLSRSLQSHIAYTWSHSIDNASNDSVSHPPGALLAPNLDRASSDFDVRHSFAGAITFSIPTPPVPGFAKRIFRNWSADGIINARSATPVDIYFERDLGFGPFNFRPDLILGTPVYLKNPLFPGGRAINRGAFMVPMTMRQGTLSRNAFRGFGVAQTNLALGRNFKLTERANLHCSLDIFNLSNRANFGNPVGDLNSSYFGQPVSTFANSLVNNVGSVGLNAAYQEGGPRTIQMTVKLQF